MLDLLIDSKGARRGATRPFIIYDLMLMALQMANIYYQ